MFTRMLVCSIIPLGIVGIAKADFQYQSTSRVTGGSLIQIMRFVPGGGALKEPQVSTVAVQGNRMVHRNKRTAELIDLDKKTITTINFDKKTYSEITFEQMKQSLDQMSAAASQQQAQQQPQQPDGKKVELDLNADIKNTGQTKTINGMEAHQVILTMSMGATDAQSGQTGAMQMNSEMWLVKEIPGAGEMREFYKRMAKDLDWAPTGMGGMMNRPDITKAMAKMAAEGEKMDGTPVQQIMRVGATASGAAGDQPAAESAPRPSLSDALGGALGGKLGGLGGFGRKKKQDSDTSASSKDTSADKEKQASTQQATASLMEMTIEDTGFSTSAVDASLFAIPADYKRVEEALPGAPRKK
jgi:hypothetical protein